MSDQPEIRRPVRMFVAAAACALLGLAAPGCGQKEAYGESNGDGLLTGYEVGNQQDIQDVRKDRPNYVPFE